MISPPDFFKLLGDETRLLILLLLHREGELCVCDLTDKLALSQPKISRHLAMLRTSALVVGRRENQWVHYQLNPELPAWMQSILSKTATQQSAFIEQRINPNTRPICC